MKATWPAYALLLDAGPAASSVAVAAVCLSTISILVAIFAIIRKESREDGQTVSQRLKKLESTVTNHDQLHTGQVQAREALAGDLLRTINGQKEEVGRRLTTLESRGQEVQNLRERMAGMEADLKRLPSIESKLDELLRLLATRV